MKEKGEGQGVVSGSWNIFVNI